MLQSVFTKLPGVLSAKFFNIDMGRGRVVILDFSRPRSTSNVSLRLFKGGGGGGEGMSSQKIFKIHF